MNQLVRQTFLNGITMVGSFEEPVIFGFTERTGGVSPEPFDSLNLGAHVDDDPANVFINRQRVLEALDADKIADRLIEPRQIHGNRVLMVDSSAPAALAKIRADAQEGCDGIVCTALQVPVLLCFADCVPVVLTAPGGFAVLHSGWRGTFARIAEVGALTLMEATNCAPSEIQAFIGPHILGDEYEVSSELIEQFTDAFISSAVASDRLLNLSACIIETLCAVGVPADNILDTNLSTMRLSDRFFSYRASGGACGRHAAVAVMR